MMSSRAAALLVRAATRSRSVVQPRMLSTTSVTKVPASNEHAWEAYGRDQEHADEGMPFQTENKPRLLAWLCFWVFMGIGIPYFQVPFIIQNPEEEEEE